MGEFDKDILRLWRYTKKQNSERRGCERHAHDPEHQRKA
jgi:hypothetical protein